MKLAELLKVDTTKENWFKLLSKKGINPKTVNAVSKGGGGNNLLPTLNEFIDKYKYVYVWKSEVLSSGTKIYLEKAIYKTSNVEWLDILFIEKNKGNIISCVFSDKEIDIENSQLDPYYNIYLEFDEDVKLAIQFELGLQNHVIVTIPVIEVKDINSI